MNFFILTITTLLIGFNACTFASNEIEEVKALVQALQKDVKCLKAENEEFKSTITLLRRLTMSHRMVSTT